MEFKFQKRRGIGNVITTLIILIASVVLGAGVIFFGGSMFTTNTQSEQVKVTNIATWVNTSNSTSAFAIQNVGSKAVTVTDIKLRGIAVPVAQWYNCKGSGAGQCATQLNVQTPLPYDASPASVSIGNPPVSYAMTAGTQVSLAQGEAAIVYLFNAGNITPIDAGNTYALQIQAGQASSVTQVSVEQK